MIGIFDSGSGGLSVLREIRIRMPSVDILYFGDIKNAPYGEKTQKELSELTVNNIRFLQSHGVESIVSACNSVSAALTVSFFDTSNLVSGQLIEMVGPTVSSFRDNTERVLLCATPATINSGIYQNGFHMVGKDLTTVAIPTLAGAIEFGAQEAELEHIIREAFVDTAFDDFDTLVLGCTHYPLIAHIFERVSGGTVRLLNPASIVAERVEKQFGQHEKGAGMTYFAITKDSAPFRSRVAALFQDTASAIEVVS